MPLAALGDLVRTIHNVKARLNRRLAVAGILPVRVGRTRLALDVLAALRKQYGAWLMRSTVRESVRVATAFTKRKPVTAYQTPAAEDYRRAARELLGRL